MYPNGYGSPADPEAIAERTKFAVRLVSITGASWLAGQLMGMVLGTWRSKQILQTHGNIANIEKVLQRAQKDVMEQVRANREAASGGPPSDGRIDNMPAHARRRTQGLPADISASARLPGNQDIDFYGRSRRDEGDNSRLARTFEQDRPFTTDGNLAGAGSSRTFTTRVQNSRSSAPESPFASDTDSQNVSMGSNTSMMESSNPATQLAEGTGKRLHNWTR